MISVPSCSWPVLDTWPVQESGLGYRARRILTEHGIRTVGDVRLRLADPDFASLSGLGPSTSAEIQLYVGTCAAIVSGTLEFADLPALLRRFLNELQIEVLLRRYGLFRPDTASSRNFITLQDIGNEFDLTRERVRQIEKRAMEKLRGQLQQHCLAPLYEDILNALKQQGNILRCDQTAVLDNRPWLGGTKASSVLLLLHDVAPTQYTYYRDTFSLIPISELKRVETWAIDAMGKAATPLSIKDLYQRLPSSASSLWNPTALAHFLAAMPKVLATQDLCFALTDRALAHWVREELDTIGAPTHYRRITQAINARLQPHQQIGPRRILLLLHSHPEFAQTQSGYYTHRKGRASSPSEPHSVSA